MAVVALCVLLSSVALLGVAKVDECQVYYGGLIFPEGARRNPEHGLHWSKTQSEFVNHFDGVPSWICAGIIITIRSI